MRASKWANGKSGQNQSGGSRHGQAGRSQQAKNRVKEWQKKIQPEFSRKQREEMARSERNDGQGGQFRNQSAQQHQGHQTSGQRQSGGTNGQQNQGHLQSQPGGGCEQQQGGYDGQHGGPGQQERIGNGIAHDYGNSASWATNSPQKNDQISNGINYGSGNSAYHSTSVSQKAVHKVGNGIDYGYGNSASWAASTPQVKERIGNMADHGYVDSSLWTGVYSSSPAAEVRRNAHQRLGASVDDDYGNSSGISLMGGGMNTTMTASQVRQYAHQQLEKRIDTDYANSFLQNATSQDEANIRSPLSQQYYTPPSTPTQPIPCTLPPIPSSPSFQHDTLASLAALSHTPPGPPTPALSPPGTPTQAAPDGPAELEGDNIWPQTQHGTNATTPSGPGLNHPQTPQHTAQPEVSTHSTKTNGQETTYNIPPIHSLTPQAFAYLMVELQGGLVSARAWGQAVEWVRAVEEGNEDEELRTMVGWRGVERDGVIEGTGVGWMFWGGKE